MFTWGLYPRPGPARMVKLETSHVLICAGQPSGAGDIVAGTWRRGCPDRMGLMVTK